MADSRWQMADGWVGMKCVGSGTNCGGDGEDQVAISYGRGAGIFLVQGNDNRQSGLALIGSALIGTG